MIINSKRIYQRWVMAVMGMLGVTMSHMLRNCLSITLTQMVSPETAVSYLKTNVDSDNYCPMPDTLENHESSNRTTVDLGELNERFHWDEKTQGKVLSAFFYGYLLTHLPGGLLSQKFGGKHTMGIGILISGIFTLMTPYVAHLGSTSLAVMRFAEGLGQGMIFPSLCALLAQWTPPKEKGKLSTLVFSGVQIGNIFANSFSSLIIRSNGWPYVFYIFGTISIIWFVLWCMFVYNDPNSHPYISDEERDYLQFSIGSLERKKDLAATPWKYILTSPHVWALVVMEAGHDWGVFTIISDLPKYMSDVLHFSVTENGLFSSIPYFAQWVTSIISSIVADRLISRRVMSITKVRKTFTIIGNIGPALGVMCASYVGCNKTMATFCFTMGIALMGFNYPGFRINSLDIAPNYSSSIMALENGIGCLSGMATPYLAGILTPNRTVLEWRLVFWIMVVIMTMSSTIYVSFGTAEKQPWNDVDVHLKEKEKEKRALPMDERHNH